MWVYSKRIHLHVQVRKTESISQPLHTHTYVWMHIPLEIGRNGKQKYKIKNTLYLTGQT